MFPWKWKLSDLSKVKQNGLKIFSCFACGGGSSMGYKLAGYTVLGNCEIDSKVAEVYKQNLHPRYSFVMDVREFLSLPDDKMPSELFELDVLDGSPPCSVFSTAGKREDGWNKEKQFAEGQKFQRLDDLFFTFIDIAKRLQPKVVVAENVTGLIKGNAKGYVNEILKAFTSAGYEVQMFELHAERMGVPQKRHRIFFIARRQDLGLQKIKLRFEQNPIPFGKVRSEAGVSYKKDGIVKELMKLRKSTDRKISDISKRVRGKAAGFARSLFADERVADTITAGGNHYRMYDGMKISISDMINVSTFPQDYDFMNRQPQFFCGMSVPPVMMANIASEIARQFFNK